MQEIEDTIPASDVQGQDPLADNPAGAALLEVWDDPVSAHALDKSGVTLDHYAATLSGMYDRLAELLTQEQEQGVLPPELCDERDWRLSGRVFLAYLDGGGYAVLHPRDGYIMLPRGADRTWVLRAVQSRWPHTASTTKLDDLLAKYAPGALLRIEDHYAPTARGLFGHALRRHILTDVPAYAPKEHPEVGAFLASLFGESLGHQLVLAQYLARAKDFTLGVPMLVLYGRANGGKTLVCNAITRYLAGAAGAIPEQELFHEFNAMLKSTPVVNIVERTTELRGATFRALTDQSTHRVNDKGEKRVTVVGKLRFVASCNELSNIMQSTLGGARGDDRDAIKRRMWLVPCTAEHAARQREFLTWCDVNREQADLAFCEHFAWLAQEYRDSLAETPDLLDGFEGDRRFLVYPPELLQEQDQRFSSAAVASLSGEDSLALGAFYEAIAKLLLRAARGDEVALTEVRGALVARGDQIAAHLPTVRERYMNGATAHQIAEALAYPEGGGKALRVQVRDRKYTALDRAKLYAWIDSDANAQPDLDTELADLAFSRLAK